MRRRLSSTRHRRAPPCCGPRWQVAAVRWGHGGAAAGWGAEAGAAGGAARKCRLIIISRAFQLWLDGFAAAFPQSLHLLVLDNGAGHKAKAVRWPAKVVPVFLPPYSPELNPMERLWRDRKDKLADNPVKTITELSDAMCAIIQHYSHATLRSLTGFAYFVHAVETAQKTLYG
jgi:hypothetical protein